LMNLYLRLKKNAYRWVAKDRKTKLRIISFSSEKRDYESGCKRIFKTLKNKYHEQFLKAKKKGSKFVLTSDKYAGYKKGHNKFLYRLAKLNHGVPIKCKKYKLKKNNNCIERDHQYSRALEKISRGHKNIETSSALFDIGDIYYNYIDKQKLSGEKMYRTPAERAKIKINLGRDYMLLNLIKQAYP